MKRNLRIPISITTDEGPLLELIRNQGNEFSYDHVRDVKVIATKEVPADHKPWPQEFGEFRAIENIYPGRELEIRCDAPVFLSLVNDQHILDTQYFEQAPQSVEFTFSLRELGESQSRVRLRIVDSEDGTSLRPKRLQVLNRNVSTRTNTEVLEFEGDGTTVLASSPGPKRLVISHPGYVNIRALLELTPGQELDLGTIRLAPEARIQGRFLDEQGEAAVCSFRFLELETDPSPHLERESLRFDGSQRGILDVPCGRGRYLILLRDDRWAREAIEVDTRTGSVEGLMITVHAGTDVSFQTSRRARTQMRIYSPRGIELWSGRLSTPTSQKSLQLVPGSYRLETELYNDTSQCYEPAESREFVVGEEDLELDV